MLDQVQHPGHHFKQSHEKNNFNNYRISYSLIR